MDSFNDYNPTKQMQRTTLNSSNKNREKRGKKKNCISTSEELSIKQKKKMRCIERDVIRNIEI